MTAEEVLAVVKAHLTGEEGAGAALADLFEEAGDDEGAKLARSGQFTMGFDDEARGKVTLKRGCYGPNIYIDSVAGGDEYVASMELLPRDGEYGHPERVAAIIVFDTRSDDWIGIARFTAAGELSLDVNTRVATNTHNLSDMRTFEFVHDMNDDQAEPI